ncbi:MAG: hypothetical protein RL759_87 [Verrucomicrobiota bacterium]|jgi:hypothetical protein
MNKTKDKFLVLCSLFIVRCSSFVVLGLLGVSDLAADEAPGTKNQERVAEVYRPEAGKFPPLEKAKAYDGQLMFVDHANRRGSLRVTGGELLHNTAPQPFAMLPYGMVRYHGAPADLRDVPLGTMMHGLFYLPPDPKLSAVPVVAKATVTQPAENHAILLEDEPSFCLREGKVWKLKDVTIKGGKQGLIVAHREPTAGGEGKEVERQMSIDASTRFWRGREQLGLADLIAEGLWPADGKKSLGGQVVHLGITWKPDGHWERRVGNRLHISDIWLDETAMQRATQQQVEVHRELVRCRWMPAYVDAVEYGKFGSATVTATLFGGMDPSLYADFKKGINGQVAASEANLKHQYGRVRHSLVVNSGPILDVIKQDKEIPLGSSGIQIRMQVGQIIEGIRPGRIVRIRPINWPDDAVPREEYTEGHLEERFPSPDIFPKYGGATLN